MRHDGVMTPRGEVERITVHPAGAEHLEAIGEMSVAAYAAGGHLPPEHPYARVLRDVGSRQDRTLVAESEGQLVGAITLLDPGHPMCELARAGEREVRFLAVRSDQWGSGIARTLMSVAEDQAWSQGAEAVVLCVIDSNSRALAFYPRLGYTRLPDRDRHFTGSAGSPVHLLAYTKAAPAPGGSAAAASAPSRHCSPSMLPTMRTE